MRLVGVRRIPGVSTTWDLSTVTPSSGESGEAEVAHLVGDVGVESGYGDADFYAGAVEEF